jgi:hypothetical protein
VSKRPSSLLDTRIIYCGDCLDQLRKLPDASIDLIYIDPPFNSNRNYEVFWGETKEKRSFEDRHESTKAYIDFMRPRCVELGRVLKKTGSFYYHCDWHASHYVKVMLDQILGEGSFQNESYGKEAHLTRMLDKEASTSDASTTFSCFTQEVRKTTPGINCTFRFRRSTFHHTTRTKIQMGVVLDGTTSPGQAALLKAMHTSRF